MKMIGKWSSMMLVAVLAFALNPYIGCGDGGTTATEYEFEGADVKNAILGTYEGELENASGEKVKFTLKLEQAEATGEKEGTLRINCDQRVVSWLPVAYACIDSTLLNVKGTFSTDDKTYENFAIKGTFMVIGTKFDNGELNLTGADSVRIFASYDGTKQLNNGKLRKGTESSTMSLSKAQ